MRDEKEERKKQARSNNQTRQSNTAHPRQSLFLRQMSCLSPLMNNQRLNTYVLSLCLGWDSPSASGGTLPLPRVGLSLCLGWDSPSAMGGTLPLPRVGLSLCHGWDSPSASGGTRTHNTLHSSQSALPLS